MNTVLPLVPSESADPARRWFVLHTKSRQEKRLASELDRLGVQHFLPLRRTVRYHGRRKVQVDLPLFAGYVFLWGTVDHVYVADRTKRVARILDVVDQQQLEWELRNVREAISTGRPLCPHEYLENGVRVEVRSGPCRGLQGHVRRMTRRSDRIVLQVDAFGGAASLEVDGALLERLD